MAHGSCLKAPGSRLMAKTNLALVPKTLTISNRPTSPERRACETTFQSLPVLQHQFNIYSKPQISSKLAASSGPWTSPPSLMHRVSSPGCLEDTESRVLDALRTLDACNLLSIGHRLQSSTDANGCQRMPTDA